MPFTPLDLLKWGFGVFITLDFIRYARSGKAGRHLTVFARRTPGEWAKALLVTGLEVTAVLTLIVLLLTLGSPVLNFSWLNLLVTSKDDPQAGTNLMVAPAQIPWFGIVFGLLLALNMPRLARREEEIFRRGTRNWREAMPRSLKFGLMHMIVGVPLGAALALGVAGLFFTWRYFVGGVREASFYHTLHNFAILILLGVYLVGR